MSKFLKLTNILFNTCDIHKIVIKPHKYHIHIASRNLNGLHFMVGGFGSGHISSNTDEIEVCETKHSIDYKIVADWIREL